MKDSTVALSATGVSHGYPTPAILNQLDLVVERNAITVMVGPSGCGKSTLLRILSGQEAPQQGKVKIGNKQQTSPNRHCGIVFQDNSLFSHLTVADNILLGKKLSKNRDCLSTEQIERLTEEVGLFAHKKKWIHELSGGMKQRVALVQSLVTKPSVLLMDEPFAALDPNSREDAQQLLLRLQKQYELSILLVTHDFFEAALLGNKIVILSQYDSNKDTTGARIIRTFDNPLMQDNVKPSVRQQILYKLIADVKRTGFRIENHFEPEFI